MGSTQAGTPPGGTRLNPASRYFELTADGDITDDMLAGNGVLILNSASPIVVTIPDTLTGFEPLLIIAEGTGAYSFVAGGSTVIKSPGGALGFNQQYGWAGITPDPSNANTYYLAGDLS